MNDSVKEAYEKMSHEPIELQDYASCSNNDIRLLFNRLKILRAQGNGDAAVEEQYEKVRAELIRRQI